jgi:N-methylhydantoinase A
MTKQRVAVDVGGTFTDVCIVDEDSRDVRVTKVPSTPGDPMQAVMDGLRRAEVDLQSCAPATRS